MNKRSTLGGRNPPRCVYCGITRPRVIVLGGKAHRRCIPKGSLPVRFDNLSKHQQRALVDMVGRNGLSRIEAGWDGTHIHRHRTVLSLEQRGLCSFGAYNFVQPSARGRGVIKAMVDETNAIIRRSESRR